MLIKITIIALFIFSWIIWLPLSRCLANTMPGYSYTNTFQNKEVSLQKSKFLCNHVWNRPFLWYSLGLLKQRGMPGSKVLLQQVPRAGAPMVLDRGEQWVTVGRGRGIRAGWAVFATSQTTCTWCWEGTCVPWMTHAESLTKKHNLPLAQFPLQTQSLSELMLPGWAAEVQSKRCDMDNRVTVLYMVGTNLKYFARLQKDLILEAVRCWCSQSGEYESL